MGQRPPTIFISAAEPSGDMHAARLITAIRRRVSDVDIVGVGGPAMAAAGCRQAVTGMDLTAAACMLTGAMARLPFYYRAVRKLRRAIADLRPDVHVPVDSPALNWHLAAAAKKSGAKVAYYIAPQVWAWAPWRVRKLARLTDAVACILPFEQQWLTERGVSATYVGHPLAEHIPPRPAQPADILGAWADGNWQIAFLAGSRQAEILAHAPALIDLAGSIRQRWPAATCCFAAKDDQAVEWIRHAAGGGDLPQGCRIVRDQTNELLSRSHFAVAVSGTVTLQAAWLGVPMVIVYRVDRVAYNLLGRWLIRTPRLALVNILAGRKVVPELMPWFGNRRQLSETVCEAMDDVGWLLETRQALIGLADSLRADNGRTASDNTAEIVAGLLNNR